MSHVVPLVRDVDGAMRWLQTRRQASALTVTDVPPERCEAWRLVDGELRHETGRYFQVVGGRVDAGPYAGWCRPMIRQHEIGLLGSIVTRIDGTVAWLVQAKTEPGNVGGTQVGPSVQATASNQDRVHGGAATRFLERFHGPLPQDRAASDVLASEQGTRFLGKRNRNMIIEAALPTAPAGGDAWAWLDRTVVRTLLGHDFAVNTDARSVAATGPWALLADDDAPFARYSDEFGRLLRRSYEAAADIGPLLGELASRRARAVARIREVPLRREGHWFVGRSDEAVDEALDFVRVDVRDREVDRWCQPLLTSAGVGRCDLYAQPRDGVLRFLFTYRQEPGLRNLVELGPSVQLEDEGDGDDPTPRHAHVRLSLLQSDEGSRFRGCVVRYRILELPPGPIQAPADGVWLAASEVEALACTPGTLTNEARSVVSLLLSLA